MATSEEADAQKRLDEAFAALEATLRDMLTAAARRSVDQTIERLSHSQGPFRLNGVEVEVIVRNLSVEAASPAGPRARPRKKTPSRRRGARSAKPGGQARGRPPGRVRTALLEAFAATASPLDTDALRAHLSTVGVASSDDNLHQQLRRLVAAGELERTGRGVYRRAGAGAG